METTEKAPGPGKVVALTTAIPERIERGMLAECMASVAQQARRVDAHLIAVDYAKLGGPDLLDGLRQQASAMGARWVIPVADDDLLLSDFVRLLEEVGDSSGASVVYSDCVVENRPALAHPGPFSPARLREGNYIPATALVRVSALDEVGGWRTREESQRGWEDWDCWLRILDRFGPRAFQYVDTPLWVYRFHGANLSMGGESG